ncbi:MAG TPA: outer membrane beta-barrel protein, partial [Caulobacteraceae bacterium]
SLRQSPATPLFQNNSGILDLIWTHTEGPWSVTPYFQYTRAYRLSAFGLISPGASTYSGAVLAKYSFNTRWSLAGRAEYLATSGGACSAAGCADTNLLYGPGSKAVSLTLTPTFQKGVFFARAEGSFVEAIDAAPGATFGAAGTARSQWRGLVETGVIF